MREAPRDLRTTVGALALVLVCSTLPVMHKFANGMVYDDSAVLLGALIHQPERLLEVFATHAMLAQGSTEIQALDTYRPIAIASFFWDAWLSGDSLWSYHLTNLLLHLGCVTCLFFLLLEVLPGASLMAVVFSALFFALSPQLAEAHVWINGRSDPLATLFGLSSLLVFRQALQQPRPAKLMLPACSGALFLLGVLSKEVLLLITPAILFWPETQRTDLLARIRRCGAFILSSLCYLGLRVWALQGMRTAASQSHLMEALPNLPILWADGLIELLAPSHLYLRSMHEEYAGLTQVHRLALTALALSLCTATVLLWRRVPVIGWSLLWFGLSLAPAVMITTLNWPGFGRYLYLPCAGLSFGVCASVAIVEEAIARAKSRLVQHVFSGALCIYLALHAVLLASVTADYRSNLTLFGAVVEADPKSAYGHGWIGVSLRDDGHPAAAIPWLEKALALGGFEPRYARSLIRAHLALGHHGIAEKLAREAVEKSRHDPRIGSEMRAQLMRALAPTSPVQTMAVLCECLDFAPNAKPCLSAMEWMTAPNSPNLAGFEQQFRAFEFQCRSDVATRAFKQNLLHMKGKTSP